LVAHSLLSKAYSGNPPFFKSDSDIPLYTIIVVAHSVKVIVVSHSVNAVAKCFLIQSFDRNVCFVRRSGGVRGGAGGGRVNADPYLPRKSINSRKSINYIFIYINNLIISI